MDKRPANLLLALILIASLILRFWGLGFQSFWLDECHTAIVADPGKSWSWLFYHLRCCEYHPPLLYILERILFGIFGYTDYVARSFTAVAGTCSVLAVYLLGKELYNQRAGLSAAALAGVNYFNIWHSQDARPYILAFLFAALSFLFFIRFLRRLDRKAVILYTLFTLLLLYTHYFSLFVLAAQITIAGFIFVLEKENRKKLFGNYALSGLLILIGYLPWLSFLLSMSAIDSIWMGPPEGGFAIAFFFEYFGNSGLLKPLLLLLPAYYCFRVFLHEKAPGRQIRNEPLLFSFLIFLIWISFTYLLPYLRSVLAVPMLQSRYTIVALPAFLVLLAISIEEIKNELIRYVILFLFIALSLISLIFVNRHYTEVKKTQFREMTAYISAHPEERFPIVNERTAWQHAYYLNQFNNKSPVLSGKKEDIIDSIVQKSSEKYDLQAFWLVGAHGDKPLDKDQQQRLEQAYHQMKARIFHDAWAQLYAVRNNDKIIGPQHFDSTLTIIMDGERIIPIWAGEVSSHPLAILPGKYRISIVAKGTPLEAVYPQAMVSANGRAIGNFTAADDFRPHEFPLALEENAPVSFSIAIENDAYHPESGEDRNIFIRYIRCEKIE